MNTKTKKEANIKRQKSKGKTGEKVSMKGRKSERQRNGERVQIKMNPDTLIGKETK